VRNSGVWPGSGLRIPAEGKQRPVDIEEEQRAARMLGHGRTIALQRTVRPAAGSGPDSDGLSVCQDGRMDDGDADVRFEVFGRLLDFLNRLDAAHVHYALGHTRPESVMVDISLPGWRWEVEFMIDGSVEIERYQSVTGVEDDPQLLEELFVDVDPT
jgi:hypothetical protein